MNPTTPAGSRVIDRLLQELAEKKAAAAAMGGPEKVAKQHARGKRTARERIEYFFDDGSFVELAVL